MDVNSHYQTVFMQRKKWDEIERKVFTREKKRDNENKVDLIVVEHAQDDWYFEKNGHKSKAKKKKKTYHIV